MRTFLAIAILGALFQTSSAAAILVAQNTRPPATPETMIRFANIAPLSAFSGLIKIGAENQIPISIIVGDAANFDICHAPLALKQGTMTLAELEAMVGETMPGYRADLQKGVLEIAPTKVPESAAKFLEMRLTRFQSASDSAVGLGFTLWRSIYGVIAPGAGSNFVYFDSLSAEKVPGIDVSDQSVKSLLDMIVDKGSGGVWVLRLSKIKSLSRETEMPFEIRSYAGGDADVASTLACIR